MKKKERFFDKSESNIYDLNPVKMLTDLKQIQFIPIIKIFQ